MSKKCIENNLAVYNVPFWSSGYFGCDENGLITANPKRTQGATIALVDVINACNEQGLALPLLVRFVDILHSRVNQINVAFETAIEQAQYQGRYSVVYPIKVNQQRQVVEELLQNDDYPVGLEAGSKPELMAVLALAKPGSTIICNGYKDRNYIRLALIGKALGFAIYLVIEKASELKLIAEEAKRLGIAPLLGLRVRSAAIGKGNWQNTGGEKSKFGLSASQALNVLEQIREAGLLPSLKLLHCHLGSQISNVRDIQKGMKEVARYYAEFHRMGARIETIDVGGGLGVDYEGTRSRSYCSMNYDLPEYAHHVVQTLADACNEHGLPHPNVVSESGRALAAHHAVLVTNVTDVDKPETLDQVPNLAGQPPILQNLASVLEGLQQRSVVESYHEAVHWVQEAQEMYIHGALNLQQRALAETLYQTICSKVAPLLNSDKRVHRDIQDELNEKLAHKVFVNLSIFQSLPDIWAIDQVFPIVPLTRLNEPANIRVALQDLTCDSDGCVAHYVDSDGVESTLPLHEVAAGDDYPIGIFMVGAYQEILGDMHNLFGDTNAVNVRCSENGFDLVDWEKGDTVDQVLQYVHFEAADLLHKYQQQVDKADLPDGMKKEFLNLLEQGLTSYTYLGT